MPKRPDDDPDYGSRLLGVLEKLKEFSIRETKKTAGLALPGKTILTHCVEMEPRQQAIYESYRDRLAHEFADEETTVVDNAEDILKRLLRLVQCASNPALVDATYENLPGKYAKLLELLQEARLDSSKKVIVWTGFVDNVEWLNRKLKSFAARKVHGRMTIADRNESIRMFKSDKNCRVLLATPGAAKEGLTLTVANQAIFYDRSFSLDDYLQAQDRIHRISQTEECLVHNLVARGTIDEWVDALLNAKHQAAQLTQGDISQSEFTKSPGLDLSAALNEILMPHNPQ